MAKPTRPGSGSDSVSNNNKDFNAQAGDTPRAVTAGVSNDNTGGKAPSVFRKMKTRGEQRKDVTFGLEEWTEKCKSDPSLYKTPAENILSTFGTPEKINTELADAQIRRVYGGQTIDRYKPFEKFYDAEAIISRIAVYLRSGGEKMLVLNGPVGSGKTQIAETMEKLTEQRPISVLKCKVTGAISPFMDSPLCLLADESMKGYAVSELGIHPRYLEKIVKSPWVTKRMNAHGGDAEAAFEVAQVYPSRESQFGIGKYDPMNKDNPDFSALIGRVDMNKVGEADALYDALYKENRDLAASKKEQAGQTDDAELKAILLEEIEEHEKRAAKFRAKTLSEGDPDAYIPGLLSKSNGGFLHLAEFLRNNAAMMNVFLEGVTTGYFTGAGGVGMLPMRQIITMTSNGPVLDDFKSAKESDAARNRILEVKVGYTLRMSEELKIYEKFLKEDGFDKLPVAPKTVDLLAEFAIAARLKDGVGAALKPYDVFTRVKVLNGEKPDGVKVPDIKELRAKASPEEGMSGFSVRDAKEALKLAFEMRNSSGIYEADTITMLEAVRMRLKEIDINDISEDEKKRLSTMIGTLEERNKKDLEKIVNAAIMSADEATCQRVFDEYVDYARAWIEGSSIHSGIGEPIDMNRITKHLEAFEKRAAITNGADFRKTTVAYIDGLKSRMLDRLIKQPSLAAEYADKPAVRWDEYEPVAKVIRAQFEVDRESRMHILRAKTEADLRSDDEKKQFSTFHENMKSKGYTDTMVSRMLHHLSYT